MSAVQPMLSNDQGLALRIIREQRIPQAYWQWLGGAFQTSIEPVAHWVDPEVSKAVNEVLEPSLAVANAWERQQCRQAEHWIASILGFCSGRSAELGVTPVPTMFAVGLLPLYRSLAVGNLNEGVEQVRHRLAECLALIGIVELLGDPCVELIDQRSTVESPYALLSRAFNVQLQTVANLARKFSGLFEPEHNDFHESINDCIQLAVGNSSRHSPAEWADPQTLWKIAEELIARKAEIVLPRPWAEVPIVWSKISDHWTTLAHRLNHPSGKLLAVDLHRHATHSEPVGHIVASNEDVIAGSLNDVGGAAGLVSEEEVMSRMIDDVVAMQADFAESMPPEVVDDDEPIVTESSEATFRAHRPANAGPVPAPNYEPIDSQVHSKIAIVEIHSKSDPVFVNLIRRQIASARSDDRTVCLMSLLVEREIADAGGLASRERGLLLWQDRLVNWLANSPDVHDPLAFTTVEGQLVLAMMDIERTLATNLLRDGLSETLGERSGDGEDVGKSHIPSKYFVGIGSVTSPNANFAAEQLIDATWRCLSAAQTQGKSTIKSIEVF